MSNELINGLYRIGGGMMIGALLASFNPDLGLLTAFALLFTIIIYEQYYRETETDT